ncbi:trypsin-like serine protease [Marinicauda algicola]|uniref:Trypsin-like serine protease n=1 Tax=Marinicauda algicola TaxID=2029849 RepID=A0A4S2H4P8_9PROT|nr:trypsin-like serine protease [Marinicauda algicola]TGY90513.1 trypsin-like serine protease [Marinicauda algicola]
MFRTLIAAALAGLVFCSAPVSGQEGQQARERLGSRELAHILAGQKPKPGAAGADTCRYAQDMECDEPGIGTGLCPTGSDYSDCWRIASGREDNSCQWARDGECDEPGFGTGACTQGTDRTDCGEVSHLRFAHDSCTLAYNGVCDEPGRGTGLCQARTDRSDCHGRERAMTFNDHFFGRDDRVVMDTSRFPWSVVGQINNACTATLIGPDILLTAAHCIEDETGRVDASGSFETAAALAGGARQARIVDYLTDPRRPRRGAEDEEDGLDWALLRIDRALGEELGWVEPLALTRVYSPAEITALRLWQAGYSWDTGTNLSGNTDCRIIEIYQDNTFAHECDTTQGDSGSPFLVEEDGRWYVVGDDSTYRRVPDGPVMNIAVSSEAWIDRYEDFAAGRIGAGGTRAPAAGKPKPTGQAAGD